MGIPYQDTVSITLDSLFISSIRIDFLHTVCISTNRLLFVEANTATMRTGRSGHGGQNCHSLMS